VAAALLCAASGDFYFLVCEGPKERVFGASVIEGEGAWLAGSCETVRRYFSMRSRPPLVLTHLFFRLVKLSIRHEGQWSLLVIRVRSLPSLNCYAIRALAV